MNLPLLLTALVSAAANLLAVPGLPEDLSGWEVQAQGTTVERVIVEDAPALHVVVGAEQAPGFPRVLQRFACAPGAVYGARANARGEGVHAGYGVYMTVEFLDAAGKRLSFFQSNAADPAGAWSLLRVRGIAPPEAVTGMVCVVLNGRGEAWFRAPEVELIASSDSSDVSDVSDVALTITQEQTCASFLGFGAEDDGWFYTPLNAEKGVDDAAIALREERIRWMDPDLIRMFFWYPEWNPSGDWSTFDWDTPGMLSHYRTLDLYQSLGAAVNVTGVEWGVKEPFHRPEKMAPAVGALLEHLIKDKGYTCIKYWTLTNEPNNSFLQSGAPFENYVTVHGLVREEIARRGLAVKIIGSDDTNGGEAWFQRCVEAPAYFDAVDLLASHQYVQHTARALAPYFMSDHLDLLAGRKPFIVAEFGFQDERSGTMENPLMEEYRYAVWAAAYAIRGLNAGVGGFTIWCMNEMYYPGGGFMNYGLMNHAAKGWTLRPVFHSWAQFARHTEAGDAVYRVTSSAEHVVQGVVAGKTLFWVNESEREIEVRIEGRQASSGTVIDASCDLQQLDAGRECVIAGNAFRAPAMSMGCVTLGE